MLFRSLPLLISHRHATSHGALLYQLYQTLLFRFFPFHFFNERVEGLGTRLVGAALSQVQNGKECVISYWSHQLNKLERKYSTIEQEALAAVAAIKEFYPFQLMTDHNPLIASKGLKDFGGQLTRWMIFLQQFHYTMEYKAGEHNSNADALSRQPHDETENGGIGIGGDSTTDVQTMSVGRWTRS